MLNNFTKKAMQTMAGLFLAGLTLAQAQDAVRINIPFDFEVQGAVMPAGQYRLESRGVSNNLMELRSVDPKQKGMLVGNMVESRPQAPGMTFSKTGDGRMVLTAFSRGGGRNSLELIAAKKRLAKSPVVAQVNVPLAGASE